MRPLENVNSSFSVIHKIGNIGIFVWLKFENKLNTAISHIHFESMGRAFHLKMLTSSNLCIMENLKSHTNIAGCPFLEL